MAEVNEQQRSWVTTVVLLMLIVGVVGVVVTASARPPEEGTLSVGQTADDSGPVLTIETEDEVVAVAWHEQRLAIALRDGGVLIYDLELGGVTQELPGRTNILAWSPDGLNLAVGGLDPAIYRTTDGMLVMDLTTEANDPLTAMAWAPDGQSIAIGSFREGVIEVLEVPTRRVISRLQSDESLYELAWLEDGQTLLGTYISLTFNDTSSLVRWDLSADEVRPETEEFEVFSFASAISPSGNLVVTTDADIRGGRAFPGDVVLRATTPSPQTVRLPVCFTGPIAPLAWSADESRVALGDVGAEIFEREDEGLIAIYDVDARECFTMTGEHTSILAFNPDGTLIATSSPDVETVTIWEVRLDPQIASIPSRLMGQ